jgi:Trypsin-like peptidase domain
MDAYSRTVARLQLFSRADFSGDSVCGDATGFFFRHENELYLITNWHVITGSDPATLERVEGVATPEALMFEYKQSIDANGIPTSGAPALGNFLMPVPLYKNGNPVWFEHSMRQNVDVVALSLGAINLGHTVNIPVNEVDQSPLLQPAAGMDCFALGYPLGMLGPGHTPIWKRGSIASEPMYNYREKLGFLIDTATRKGMSGAPVILRHSGILKQAPGPGLGPNDLIGTMTRFIGIYSGRIGEDEFQVQLGMVWRAEVLNDILSRRTHGFNPRR